MLIHQFSESPCHPDYKPQLFSWFFEVEMLNLESALTQQFCWFTLAQCRPQKDKHWWDEPWPKTNPLIMIFVWNDRWPLGPICHTGQHLPAKSHEKPHWSMEWYIVFTMVLYHVSLYYIPICHWIDLNPHEMTRVSPCYREFYYVVTSPFLERAALP